MAYDEDLANRIRECIGLEEGLTEKKMFGGLSFLINGHLSVTASGRGGLMLRVYPADSPKLLGKPHVKQVFMRGREMPGWLIVAVDGIKTKRQIEPWVKRGVAFARTLPPKG